MNCIKCNTENTEGAKFCIRCGNDLQNQPIMKNNMTANQQNMNMQTNTINDQQLINNINTNTTSVQPQNTMINNEPLNIMAFIIGALIKPIRCFKEEESKLYNPKSSMIVGFVTMIIAVVFSLLNKVISLVVVKDYFDNKITWEWDNLEQFEWLKVIGKDILLFGGIIFGVALLFYLASLIIKKDTNYMKMVSITSIALLPAILGSLVLGPILGLLWNKLAIVLPIIGKAYMFILMYELINKELKLEGDSKIYFNLVCFSIMIVALYFINLKYISSSISSDYDDLLSSYSNLFS